MSDVLKKWIRLGIGLGVIAGLTGSVLFVKEGVASGSGEMSPAFQERLAAWHKLREENPEAFQKFIGQRKNQIQGRLRHLRETDPEQFQQAKQNLMQHERQNLRRLQARNPEQFKEFMQRKMQRIEQRNPEQFQRFLENHPRMKSHLGRMGPREKQGTSSSRPPARLAEAPAKRAGIGPRERRGPIPVERARERRQQNAEGLRKDSPQEFRRNPAEGRSQFQSSPKGEAIGSIKGRRMSSTGGSGRVGSAHPGSGGGGSGGRGPSGRR